MKDIRTKIAIAAVVFGLGGLGGFAIASNPANQHQLPGAAITSQAGPGTPRVTTGASGAVTAPAINAPTSAVLPQTVGVGGGGRDD